MIQIELTAEERLTLRNLLENCLADLRMEIIQTDNINYKTMLKKKKAVLLQLQQTLIPSVDEGERLIE